MGHPEGLCLEFGAGRRRLAGSAPAPPARARIWTLIGIPGYVSSRFPQGGWKKLALLEESRFVEIGPCHKVCFIMHLGFPARIGMCTAGTGGGGLVCGAAGSGAGVLSGLSKSGVRRAREEGSECADGAHWVEGGVVEGGAGAGVGAAEPGGDG